MNTRNKPKCIGNSPVSDTDSNKKDQRRPTPFRTDHGKSPSKYMERFDLRVLISLFSQVSTQKWEHRTHLSKNHNWNPLFPQIYLANLNYLVLILSREFDTRKLTSTWDMVGYMVRNTIQVFAFVSYLVYLVPNIFSIQIPARGRIIDKTSWSTN